MAPQEGDCQKQEQANPFRHSHQSIYAQNLQGSGANSDNQALLPLTSHLSVRHNAPPTSCELSKQLRARGGKTAIARLISPTVCELLLARILNVSVAGMKIRLTQALQPGMRIKIRMKHTLVFAEVRDCLQAGQFFEARILIQDVYSRNRPERSKSAQSTGTRKAGDTASLLTA